MAQHNETGKQGEKIAIDYLQNLGYHILEANWRFSRAEIDIIAKDDEILVFVEVKTRTSTLMGQPEEFVTKKKEKLLADAASVYMKKIKHDWEIRFDIISVILKDETLYKVNHFKDAFFPGII